MAHWVVVFRLLSVGLASLLSAGCTPSSGDSAPAARDSPERAPESEAAAKPEPTAAPEPEPEPTATPEPEPTIEPPSTPTVKAPLPSDLELMRFDVPDAFPDVCSVKMMTETLVDIGTMEDILAVAVAGRGTDHRELCKTLGNCRGCSPCEAEGPWVVNQDDGEVALVVPLVDGRYGRVPRLALYMDGTEESALLVDAAVYGLDPIEAWIHMDLAEEDCADDEEGEMCGLASTVDRFALVNGLPNGQVLLTRVEIDVTTRAGERASEDLPEVELRGRVAMVRACGRRTKLMLPEALFVPGPSGAAPEAQAGTAPEPEPLDLSEGTEPRPPFITATEAKAAGQLCGAGWTSFKAGDLDAAERSIERALARLVHAEDARGRKSFGACLYNRGRIAEARGHTDEARRYYEHSLAVRPNDTVAARLASLSG